MTSVASPGPSGPLYIYGLCLAATPPLTLPPGIEGEVSLVVVDALAALVEANLDLEALQEDNSRLLGAVLSHDRVLCDLFRQMPLLPLRFGTQLPSLDHLQAHLNQEQTTYRDKLIRLTDQAEYQIKLVPADLTPPSPPEGLKGREYFLAKKQRLHYLTLAQQQQQDEQQRLLQVIASTYADAVIDDASPEPKVYLLVPNAQVDALALILGQWQAEAPLWQMQISDPLPPYHFV